jgi:hypothetical protein
MYPCRTYCIWIFLVALLSVTALADVPRLMDIQGKLTDDLGDPFPSGEYFIQFEIYDAPIGGTALWSSTGYESVMVEDGLFSYVLGSSNPLPWYLGNTDELWLGMRVDGSTEMSPRIRLTTVVYALRSLNSYNADTAAFAHSAVSADNADTADFAYTTAASYWSVVDSILTTNNYWAIARGGVGNALYGDSMHTMVNLGVGCTTGTTEATRNCATIGGGYGNKAINSFTTVAGGNSNTARDGGSAVMGGWYNAALGPLSFIGGGEGNTTMVSHSVVGGGSINQASEYGSAICGGLSNKASGYGSAIVGGESNDVSSYHGFIGGGTLNRVSGGWSAVAGGTRNSTEGEKAFIGGGNLNSAKDLYATIAGGLQNDAFYSYSFIGGGRENKAWAARSAVAGGYNNKVRGDYGFIGVGSENTIDLNGDYSSIVGGQLNESDGSFSFIGGGFENLVSYQGQYSAIGGGQANCDSAKYCFIGGGRYNLVLAILGTIGGGDSNIVGNEYSDSACVIGGGMHNRVNAAFATIGGGRENRALSHSTTVAGGWNNTASGNKSTVGGGNNNLASGGRSTIAGGVDNTVEGLRGTIAGGNSNFISGESSTIGGGINNIIAGNFSAIPGGHNDTITVNAHNSFAFGNQVHVNTTYKAVFFDGGRPGRLGLNRDDSDGGIDYPIHVGTNTANGNGAYLTNGGTWQSTSTRTAKEKFEELDADDVLAALARMPVTAWNYKGTEERHIGPVSEDFVAAFDVGTMDKDGARNNTSLSHGDLAGIGLVAIQELHRQNQEQKQEISTLKAQIAELQILVRQLLNEQ